MNVEITIKNYRCFSDENPVRINIRNGFTAFVGVNNSGKSSILKFFYEFRHLFERIKSPQAIYSIIQRSSITFAPNGNDWTAFWNNTNDRDIEINFRFLDIAPFALRDEFKYISEINIKIPRNSNTLEGIVVLNDGVNILDNMINGYTDHGISLRGGRPDFVNTDPTSMVLEKLHKTVYFGPARNAINIGSNEHYFDVRVGQAFFLVWRSLKSGTNRQQNEAIYRLTEDIRKIFGYDQLEINTAVDDQTLQLFINGRSYMLAEVGAGLSQFILVLANAATQRPALILIDEPELNLHPSLQLDFLTTLASYASSGVLFATHSIGLARASAERVYSVRRIEQGQSEVQPYEATSRLSQFVGELSFAGYRDLGFNKILLVEGTGEIKTIQQFLRLYGKDHEILLLSLGGSSLINGTTMNELEEIKRISENIYAIIDSERPQEGVPLTRDRQAFVDNCTAAGIRCHVLERRAIENYLTDTAVKRVKGANYRALQPFELLKQVQNGWSKSDNWRIAREMTKDDLLLTDLGQFLVNELLQ